MDTNVSERHIASIFRAKVINQNTGLLSVTGKTRTMHDSGGLDELSVSSSELISVSKMALAGGFNVSGGGSSKYVAECYRISA